MADRPWYDTILSKGVERSGECLLWKGSVISGGYGRIVRLDSGTRRVVARAAHRVSYEKWHGPIPDGFQIDHVCHNEAAHRNECEGRECLHRRCINPAHLEAKTQADNIRASPLPTRWGKNKTHCPKGHPHAAWSELKKRDCLPCRRVRDLARYYRKKAEKANG